ncbi:MAG: imidazole glycerol phosphate synthase subunit HisH [Planctomycetaceae bacterium]
MRLSSAITDELHLAGDQLAMIHIVDYGMGNLRSVQKAFEKLDVEARICTLGQELADADRMVLPGVGAFRDAIAELKKKDMVSPITDHVAAGRPFLGICLGQQLLFDVSFEDGEFEGLGLIPGEVVRFENQPDLKIPHMGWNSLDFPQTSPIFKDIPQGAYVYFVHSYHTVPQDPSVIAARTGHGTDFVSSVARGNLFATQFHPEKSQKVGLQILQNFSSL